MRIAIDASFIYTNVGFGTYSGNLIKALARIDAENEYFLLSNRLPGRIALYNNISENRRNSKWTLPANFKCIESDKKIRQLWSRYRLPDVIKENSIHTFHAVDNITGRFKKKTSG